MRGIVAQLISQCRVCNGAKYLRKPLKVYQMITSTASMPPEHVFFFFLKFESTDCDRRLAFTHPINSKAADGIVRGLVQLFCLLEIPNKLSSDWGKTFNNVKIRRIINKYKINYHFGTSTHHNSQGLIEQFHNTLTEHLLLNRLPCITDFNEASMKSVLAYYHTVHSATGYTPFRTDSGIGL